MWRESGDPESRQRLTKMTKEVVTIQVGNQANYIASHFWNLQQAQKGDLAEARQLDPTPFFRESSHAAGTHARTHPRAQVIDATGAFGSFSTQAGRIIEPVSESAAKHLAADSWGNTHQVFVHESVPPHDLSSPTDDTTTAPKRTEVKYWSDFLTPVFHHRACHPLAGVHHDVTNVSHFATGVGLASANLLDDLYDDLHLLIEECDSLGGLVLVTNADDAFAGLTSAYLAHITQELGARVPTLVHAAHARDRACTRPSASSFGRSFDQRREDLMRANEAALLHACVQYDGHYVPLSSLAASRLPGTLLSGVDIAADAYRSTAPLALGMHAALSPLHKREGLGGLLASVRPRTFACYSSLYANLAHDGLLRTVDGVVTAVFRHGATVNMSDLWGSADDRLGIRNDESFLCARGFPDCFPAHLRTDWGIAVPRAFPPVLDGLQPHLLGNGADVQRVPIVAGLAFDRDAAVAGLRGLADSVGRTALSKTGVVDVVDRNEIEECFRCFVEDIVDR